MKKRHPEFFKRQDERPDKLFYKQPRRVKHIDEGASRAAEALYDELLPAGGSVLDLMASYYSHLPEKFSNIVGLGLNHAELEENEQINKVLIQDLNQTTELPFDKNTFDGAVCTVSIQYLTCPDEVFAEVARVLKPRRPFIITFSNRMFPTKAILAWRASDDEAHIRLVKSYFEHEPKFAEVQTRHHTPKKGDPLFAVWAHKSAEGISLN